MDLLLLSFATSLSLFLRVFFSWYLPILLLLQLIDLYFFLSFLFGFPLHLLFHLLNFLVALFRHDRERESERICNTHNSTLVYWVARVSMRNMSADNFHYNTQFSYNTSVRWCEKILIFMVRIMLSLALCPFSS